MMTYQNCDGKEYPNREGQIWSYKYKDTKKIFAVFLIIKTWPERASHDVVMLDAESENDCWSTITETYPMEEWVSYFRDIERVL